jgi:hypothetical protein
MGFVSFLVILIYKISDTIERIHESYRNGEKTPILLLLPDRFIYIEVLDGAIQKKQKNGQQLKQS